jgi:hypothetical protein
MDITISIPDAQWEQFQQVAHDAVETTWNGKYEDFAIYIMSINLDNYIESQKRKQAKKMKQALASYEASMAKETKEATVPITKPDPAPPLPKPVKKQPEDKPREKGMTNKELAERIAQLEEVPFKRRTMAEAQELNDLLISRKKRDRKK